MSASGDLRNRRHEQTRAEIAAAALDLFLSAGFDATTMGDVATAAGVSRRTAYRHFANKDELVFEQPRLWLEHFVAVIEARADGEPVRDLLRRAIFAVAEHIEEHRDEVLRSFAVLTSTESLVGRHGRSDAEWRELCAGVIVADSDGSPEAQLQTVIATGALIGATNAMIAGWAAAQPGAHLPTVAQLAFDQIDSIWPEFTR